MCFRTYFRILANLGGISESIVDRGIVESNSSQSNQLCFSHLQKKLCTADYLIRENQQFIF